MFENIKEWLFGTAPESEYNKIKEDIQSKGGNIQKVDETEVPSLGKIVAFVIAIFKKSDDVN